MKCFMFLAIMLWAAPLMAEGNAAAPFIKVGDFSVYPILDRDSVMKADLFSGPLTKEERLRFMPGGQAPASVNIFLIKGPDGNLLVDAGWGSSGEGRNHIPGRLKEAGVELADIDAVLLTHMHPDHIGGLLEDGKAALPKADIWVDSNEYAFWIPQDGADGGQAGLQAKMAGVYKGRIKMFEPGGEILPALSAVQAYGHTPGHVAFKLKSGGEELLFVGDIVHAAVLQFPNPEECASYDQDQKMAVTARRDILNLAVNDQALIAGAHIPYPGIGRVDKKGDGFGFTPLSQAGK